MLISYFFEFRSYLSSEILVRKRRRALPLPFALPALQYPPKYTRHFCPIPGGLHRPDLQFTTTRRSVTRVNGQWREVIVSRVPVADGKLLLPATKTGFTGRKQNAHDRKTRPARNNGRRFVDTKRSSSTQRFASTHSSYTPPVRITTAVSAERIQSERVR